MIGKTLGNFECTALIGRGGMGEVYRAKDRKLGRDVAIKVLPEEFAKDADRVARFQREAKLLASLNHPSIAAIYGLEESGGINFLVLELVEGETLADRIKKGLIPVEESLKLALQIAEALEAAHEKGVIHRDLKPANIKITPDGKVKVLDFGLAKAFAGEQADLNLSNSPTLSEAATLQGVILGTAAYMSPEQARGKTVDKRTDIWAFGCVLYEMLTGQAAFQGEDVTEILAAVVKLGADLDLLPANIHPRVREVLGRCLQKDMKDRYRDIGDARFEIKQALADPGGLFVQSAAATKPRTKMRLGLAWVAAAVALAAIIAGAAVWKLKPSEPRQVMRFTQELPEGQQFSNLLFQSSLAVSPDGRQIVYATPKGLYLRSVDEWTAKLIPGTEGDSQQPFFSPDGKWIKYVSVADRKLKKIAIDGRVPVALCGLTSFAGADWSADNTIVYGQLPGDIMRVSANGGIPQSFVKMNGGFLASPQILPDGKSVLYRSSTTTRSWLMVQSLKSGETKKLFESGAGRYLPTGHIVYLRANNLFAVPFDLDKLEVTGSPVPVLEGIRTARFSDSGTMVYVPQPAVAAASTSATSSGQILVWVDRDGKEELLGVQPGPYLFPAISPDGTQIALTHWSEDDYHILIWDLRRKTLRRLTFDKSEMQSTWTPDSKQVLFFSGRGGKFGGVFRKQADGTGEAQKVVAAQDRLLFPHAISRDGKILVVVDSPSNLNVKADISMISLEGDHARKALFQQDKYLESQPKISVDGRWMAYTSNESGEHEVYVCAFPDVNKGKWQVSTGGGDSPLWSPDGGELFYFSSKDSSVTSVVVERAPVFKWGAPRRIFSRIGYFGGGAFPGVAWDIHPDGKRFLMMKQPEAPSTAVKPRKIIFVTNWFEELKQRVPTK